MSLKLELGGGRRVEEGWTCVDRGDYGQEHVIDIENEGLWDFPDFPDQSVDELRSHYFLEHIGDVVFVMNECWRVLKPGGEFSIKVPRFPHDNAVSDPAHKSWWVEDTFTKYLTGVWPVNADYGINPWRIKKIQVYDVQIHATLVKPRPIPIVMAYSQSRPRLLEQALRTLKERTRYPHETYSEHDESGMANQVSVRNELLGRADDWEFAVSLDDDVFLNDGWLCAMVEALRLNPDVGLLAGTTYPTHRVLEKRPEVCIAETVSGVCLLVPRETWEAHGPFGVGLPKGKLWDDELAQRVRRAGKQVACLADQTRVVHCGITSVKGKGRSLKVEMWMRELAERVGAVAE